MNWDVMEGNWKQFKGHVKEKWGKLTDDNLDAIAGKRDQLAGKLQETYGITKDQTEMQLKESDKPRGLALPVGAGRGLPTNSHCPSPLPWLG